MNLCFFCFSEISDPMPTSDVIWALGYDDYEKTEDEEETFQQGSRRDEILMRHFGVSYFLYTFENE